jgi:NADH-quinone oxidoreductase subunit M
MILAWLITIPLAAGVLAWLLPARGSRWCRWLCLAAMAADLALACALWARSPSQVHLAGGRWLAELDWEWIPQFGIRFHLAMDGLSLLMVLLTGLLGVLAVAASWTPVREKVRFFHFNLMLVLAGVVGVFLAVDLFLFYFFWELMLVPMYFLIDIWGHENRHYAAVKFFLFTQLSGLLMLLSILGLYFAHHRATGVYTFDLPALVGTALSPSAAMLMLMGFLAAFLVKLPAVGLHTWLPDAHTEAPTAGSVILAGLLLKTGAYGLLRFAIPLFPAAAAQAATVMMAIGAAGVVYGALQAFGQTDLKRLVAYTSVSHLGFVLLGVFAGNTLALQGAVMQMICHGLSTGALFVIAGMLQDRLGTRDLRRMGGLWSAMPKMGGMTMFFAMASLGLPGLGNFVAEFLVLLGAYRANPAIAVIATCGLVLATLYSLWIIYLAFHGPRAEADSGAPGAISGAAPGAMLLPVRGEGHGAGKLADLRAGELAILGILAAMLLWLGLWPQAVLDTAAPALGKSKPTATQPSVVAAQLSDKSGAMLLPVCGEGHVDLGRTVERRTLLLEDSQGRGTHGTNPAVSTGGPP